MAHELPHQRCRLLSPTLHLYCNGLRILYSVDIFCTIIDSCCVLCGSLHATPLCRCCSSGCCALYICCVHTGASELASWAQRNRRLYSGTLPALVTFAMTP